MKKPIHFLPVFMLAGALLSPAAQSQASSETMYTYCKAHTYDDQNNRFAVVSDVFVIEQGLATEAGKKFKAFLKQHPKHRAYMVDHKLTEPSYTDVSCWASASFPPKTREEANKLRDIVLGSGVTTTHEIAWAFRP